MLIGMNTVTEPQIERFRKCVASETNFRGQSMIAVRDVKGNAHIIRTSLETRDILTKDLRQEWL